MAHPPRLVGDDDLEPALGELRELPRRRVGVGDEGVEEAQPAGYDADTIMTMIFKYIQNQHKIDVASALSVVAFLIVIVIVAVYVRVVKPMKEV